MNLEEIKQFIKDYQVKIARLESEIDTTNKYIYGIIGNKKIIEITKIEENIIKGLISEINHNKNVIIECEKGIRTFVNMLPKFSSNNISQYFIMLYFVFIIICI